MRALRRASSALVVFAGLAAAPAARAVMLDPNFVQTLLPGSGLGVTSMAWATDGSERLFLTTKDGVTRIVERGVLLDEPFMTVPEVYTGSECGLLGVAFDPNFAENGFVYFFVTVSSSEQRIVRYRAMGNVGVDPVVIVSGLPTNGANHDGGALAFGPDGKLYWAIGDLGNYTGVDADLSLLASKVGRVNRDGSVPLDNPFYDGTGPNEDRIWARGFRNPFTMTFRPTTGDLWVNGVGAQVEQVFVIGKGEHAGWVMHEFFQPAGFREPVISYQTNGSYPYVIEPTGAVRNGGVATFTTTIRHWIHPGERMTIAGVADPSFNGIGTVTSTPSTTTFTIEQAGPDAMSGGGSADTPYIGGCITGGTFYDSTAASADYRGDFFFGDFNSGNITRVRLAGDAIRSVEPWANGHFANTDMSVGPDGDLYTVSAGSAGPIRNRFQATSQYLVVSRTNVWMLEGGLAAFNIRLSMPPASDINVSTRLPSARAGLTITSGRTLTFGPSDWDTPKPVMIEAPRDDDTTDDVVELTVAALDLPIESIRVRIIDEVAAVDPPEGGAGGEPGAAGEAGEGGRGDGGVGGLAGEGSGDTGGTSSGRGGSASGRGGSGAEGGQPDGEGGAPHQSKEKSESSDGCGCAMTSQSGGGAGLAVVALALLRRVRRPSRRAKR